MKYTTVIMQTKRKIYVKYNEKANRGLPTDIPKVFDNRSEAEIEIYKIWNKDIQKIKELYCKHWESKVSWKKFRKGYNRDTQYLVEEIDDSFFDKILVEIGLLDRYYIDMKDLCELIENISFYGKDTNISIMSLNNSFEDINLKIKYDDYYKHEITLSVLDKIKYKTCLNTFPTVVVFELCSQIVNEYLGEEKWGYIEGIKEDNNVL